MQRSSAIDAHARALQLAQQCAAFDARPQTIAIFTGLPIREIGRYFPPERMRCGRFPSSPEWFHTRNLLHRAEASIVVSLYRRIRELGFSPQEALLSSFQRYRNTVSEDGAISFDRAFNLVCHLDALWFVRERAFDLQSCRRCGSRYLAPLNDVSNVDDCMFCHLVKRYRLDPRVQARFPARPLPDLTGFARPFRA